MVEFIFAFIPHTIRRKAHATSVAVAAKVLAAHPVFVLSYGVRHCKSNKLILANSQRQSRLKYMVIRKNICPAIDTICFLPLKPQDSRQTISILQRRLTI